MRILHTEASCGWGGQEIRILEEASGLIARGHDVSLACPRQARIFAEAGRYGVPAAALPIGRKNLRGLLALRSYIARCRPDALNTHSSTDSWLASLACQTLKNAPPIVRTRHISSAIPANASSRWLYTRAVSHVVTTGEALRRQVVKQAGADPARVSSVPTGVDPDRFKPGDSIENRRRLGLDPDKHYIGIVATLRSWKGHLYLLDAFTELDAAGWNLLIVGGGPMRENIEARVGELGIAGRTILAGQQRNPEDWLRAMDIFCLPSYANEGVPQAMLQAMFTALPIITTPVGAILEAVSDGETALVVPARDAPGLADALRRLVQAPLLGAGLGQAARGRAIARFSRAAMLDRMETVFAAAVGSRA